jgi:hypothetical protein
MQRSEGSKTMKKLENLFHAHYKGTDDYEAPGKLSEQFDRIASELIAKIAPLLADKSRRDDCAKIVVDHLSDLEALAFCAGFRYSGDLFSEK